MALTILFSAWVSTSIISWQYDWRIGSTTILLGIIVYIFTWNNRLVKNLLNKLQKSPVTWIRKASNTFQPFSAENNFFKIKVLACFTAGWVIYFVAWAGYGAAWPELRPTDGIWLCALYTIAWLAGYLSFLSPSGLGVRELVFITLAHNFPDDAVAGMAILGRTTLLLVDIILGIAFISCREPTHERP